MVVVSRCRWSLLRLMTRGVGGSRCSPVPTALRTRGSSTPVVWSPPQVRRFRRTRTLRSGRRARPRRWTSAACTRPWRRRRTRTVRCSRGCGGCGAAVRTSSPRSPFPRRWRRKPGRSVCTRRYSMRCSRPAVWLVGLRRVVRVRCGCRSRGRVWSCMRVVRRCCGRSCGGMVRAV